MIEVLESAGLLKNVCKGTVDQESKMLQLKFTLDEKTGAKITGMLGRKGQLDQTYYECLDLERLEKEEGPKIFLFHTSVAEMLPKEMSMIEAQPLSSFPKGFDYYAGGHIHIPTKIERERDRPSVYPGALFPNNLQELEKFPYGSYFLAEFSREGWKIEQKKIELFKLEVISPECNGKTPDLIEKEIKETLGGRNLENTLVIIRLEGKLKSGKATDINLKLITEMLELQGAYLVMRNTSKLVTEEYEEVMLAQSSPEETEEKIINEHLQQMKVFGAEKEKELIKGLLQAMNTSKKEGETNPDFQKRVEEEAGKMMGF
jgi:DNA repair exonuclease SbcCD nuclease subunit